MADMISAGSLPITGLAWGEELPGSLMAGRSLTVRANVRNGWKAERQLNVALGWKADIAKEHEAS